MVPSEWKTRPGAHAALFLFRLGRQLPVPGLDAFLLHREGTVYLFEEKERETEWILMTSGKMTLDFLGEKMKQMFEENIDKQYSRR